MLDQRFRNPVTIDDKGRITLPVRLRSRLQDKGLCALVLTCYDGGINGYLPSYFEEEIEGPIAKLDRFATSTRDLEYDILAFATACRIDAQGRIRLTTTLLEEAGLEPGGKAILMSILDRIEIWNEARLRERLAQAKARRRGAAMQMQVSE